jgi:butyryl-CoA dehydrogenase
MEDAMPTTAPNVPDWPDPADPLDLTATVARLADADGQADEAGIWPEELWEIVRAAGAPLWSLPGSATDRSTMIRRYARLAEGSLTAAFILTQHDSAVRRLALAADRPAGRHWLQEIGAGRAFATVGISQLTTSRRHGTRAVEALEIAGGYRLVGAVPWVTAAPRADVVVTGAVLADGRQLLIALPMDDRPGLSVRVPFPLAALQASCTSEIALEGVAIDSSEVLAGPSADVLATPGAGGTGGLETSALALGQGRAALLALAAETVKRSDLAEPIEALSESWSRLARAILDTAEGRPEAVTAASIRGQANALVLRLTQAYLTARKGTGFLRTEPAQRWARQALFFLVWSCPAPVAEAAIRDLAGLCSA